MDFLTRRNFLERSAALAAGGLIVGDFCGVCSTVKTEPHMEFPRAPRDRIAITSYPFRAFIDSPANHERNPAFPAISLEQFAAQVVTKFNVHNIEPHSRHFRSLDPAYLHGFRQALDKLNVKIVDLALSAQSFYDADVSARKQAIAFAKQWVDAAVQLAAPSIRPHIQRASNSPPNVQRAAETLREVTDYASERNVLVILENDDLVSEDAFFLIKVIEAVNNPYLRALPDFANSMLAGDAEFNYRSLQAMFQHAYHVCHIKDGESNDEGKEFRIDLKRAFDILKSSRYRGYCSIEFDAPGDPYAPTAKLIEQTVNYLSS